MVIVSGAASTRITNEDCTPTRPCIGPMTATLWRLSTAKAVLKQGGDSWYFVTADYLGGHTLGKDATDVIKAAGGKVVGSSRHPFPP